jgi:chromate transporter
VARTFLKLGCISFGGPIAHLGYLREECVVRRGWIDDARYSDLVALCQFLPGPSSSQMVFALGMHRAGWIGGLLASLCFTLPSALLMIGFAYGVSTLGDLSHAGWLHGLKLAAVAVVAQAVLGMGRSLCPDRPRLTIAALSAAFLLIMTGALPQIGVLVAGGVAGWLLYGQTATPTATTRRARLRDHIAAGSVLLLFLFLLILLPVLAVSTGSKEVAVFDGFYRAGSLVFGGGHVVLPLLRAEVVPNGWVSDNAFLAGYGAAQAVPGPLFTFAGYLGAVMEPGQHAWLRGVWCLLAIFLPAWLLIGGAIPFWQLFRTKAWAQGVLAGANAAVAGILLAAFFYPVWSEGVKNPRDIAAAVIAFALLHWWRLPPWLLVLLAAGAGQWILA